MRETESGLELVLPKPFSVSSWVSDLREVKWQVDSRGKGRAFRLTRVRFEGKRPCFSADFLDQVELVCPLKTWSWFAHAPFGQTGSLRPSGCDRWEWSWVPTRPVVRKFDRADFYTF